MWMDVLQWHMALILTDCSLHQPLGENALIVEAERI
jgi:hypothetical protein